MGPPIRAYLSHPLRLLLACLVALLVSVCSEPPAELQQERRPARRVVSLVPALTETIVALGRSERLVAIGDYDAPVPDRPELPRLGDAASVSAETILALDPDLVLVNSAQGEAALAPLRSRVRIERIRNDRLDEVFDTIARLGHDLDATARADELISELRGALAAARERAAGRSVRPRVAIVVQRRPLYVAGGGSYVDDLLQAIGAENAFGDVDEPWPNLSEETLVARAPQVLLDASIQLTDEADAEAALRRSWEALPSVPAVRDDRVVLMREDALFRAGPRLDEALRLLETLVFGEDGE